MKKSTIWFFLVFLAGVICANVLGVVLGRELGAMNEYFINRYLYTEIHGQELFLYLFYKRAPEFLILLILSVGIYGTLVVDCYLSYLGFSVGFLSVIAIMNAGISGSVLTVGFFFPQWLFYVPVLLLWRYELMRYKGLDGEYAASGRKKRRQMKLAASFLLAIALLFTGLFLESYVNPHLLKKIIQMLGRV